AISVFRLSTGRRFCCRTGGEDASANAYHKPLYRSNISVMTPQMPFRRACRWYFGYIPVE
ncbi:MAG: hypothetical protein WCL39_06560, partial [Armatimonadota bacterium]